MDGDLPRQIALGDRRRHQGDVPHLRGQPIRHGVDGVREVLPGTGHSSHLGLSAQLALGTHLDRDPRHLLGECRQLIDQVVDRTGHLQELAAQRSHGLVGRVRPELHPLFQITVGHRRQHPPDLRNGPCQVVDQLVRGIDGRGPGALAGPGLQALGELPLAPDHATYPGQLAGEMEIAVGDLIEDGRDLRHRSLARDGQTPAEIPVAHRHQAGFSSLLSAAASTSMVPLRCFFTDCPPFVRVFDPRATTPDSTVSLPQGLTVSLGPCLGSCPVPHWLTATVHRRRVTMRTSNR